MTITISTGDAYGDGERHEMFAFIVIQQLADHY